MPRKQKKYHYIYKTTCKVNGKYYVGMHSTDNLDDGYMGSGKHLWNSIRKYGRDNFVIEKLEFFENRKGLVDREKEMVNEDLLKDPMCMNLRPGGEGGFISEEQQRSRSIAANKALNNKLKNDKEFKEKWLIKMRKGVLKAMANGKMPVWTDTYDWNGKSHTEETKKKMSESHNGKGLGKANSQYGTCWITKNGENKKIVKTDLNKYIESDWLKGRNWRYPVDRGTPS